VVHHGPIAVADQQITNLKGGHDASVGGPLLRQI
jgi:hypothetical protein